MITAIGVDPGKHGAYAVVRDGILLRVVSFEEDIKICRTLAYQFADLIVVERVTASPQQGVVSAFTFGRYAEAAETAAQVNCYVRPGQVHLVRPIEWQSALGCLSGEIGRAHV